MTTPIALQLYTLRSLTVKDYAGVIRKVAAMGYAGVETAGFDGTSPEAAGKLFKELGLSVCSAHSPMPLGNDKNKVLDTMAAIGCKTLICPWIGSDSLATVDLVKKAVDKLNEAGAVAKEHHLAFGYHNHSHEFAKVEGKLVIDIMLEYLSKDIFLQMDTYWVQFAGLDANEELKRLGKRVQLLHIKDGPLTKGDPMTAVGEGKMDVASIIKTGEAWVKWLIVEMDAVAGDPLVEVEKSIRYMVAKGLGHGK
jgi:sugar phosphate isomerase/epimerase